MKNAWRRIRGEIAFSLWVALAGAAAAVGYGLWTGAGGGSILSWAITGAIVASVILTAIKMLLDL